MKMPRPLKMKLLVALASLTTLAACAADDGGEPTHGSEPKEAELAASLTLANGHVLEFYDLGTTAAVSERGQALSSPLYSAGDGDSEDLVGVWNKFAQGRPAPAALVSLQDRLEHYEGASSFDGSAAPGDIEQPTPGVASTNKSQCNNGCCNRDWLLQTFPLCRTDPRQWHTFDEQSPTKNGKNVFQMIGFVCAASAATWDITVDGKLTRFNMPTAQFRTFDIVKVKVSPWYDTKPFVTHTVNTVVRTVNPGTATYCGFIDTL